MIKIYWFIVGFISAFIVVLITSASQKYIESKKRHIDRKILWEIEKAMDAHKAKYHKATPEPKE